MKSYFDIRKFKKKIKNAIVVIGVFDGLHKGHQALIKKAVKRAKVLKGQVCIMTFYPHPVQVLRPEVQLPTLASLEYRLKLLEDLKADICFILKFTKKFSQLSSKQFIEQYLNKAIKPREVFVGYDFRFGKDREGGLELFKKLGVQYGFKVNILKAIKGKRKAISSTRIRNLITEGKLTKAKGLLGRAVSIMGDVKRGDARGSALGFPTANIDPNCEVIPPRGVYAVKIKYKNKYLTGMANIGRRPSFKKHSTPLNIEVHIFNFKENIYGKDIIVEFVKKIRDEKTFLSKEALIGQLKRDESRAKSILRV